MNDGRRPRRAAAVGCLEIFPGNGHARAGPPGHAALSTCNCQRVPPPSPVRPTPARLPRETPKCVSQSVSGGRSARTDTALTGDRGAWPYFTSQNSRADTNIRLCTFVLSHLWPRWMSARLFLRNHQARALKNLAGGREILLEPQCDVGNCGSKASNELAERRHFIGVNDKMIPVGWVNRSGEPYRLDALRIGCPMYHYH